MESSLTYQCARFCWQIQSTLLACPMLLCTNIKNWMYFFATGEFGLDLLITQVTQRQPLQQLQCVLINRDFLSCYRSSSCSRFRWHFRFVFKRLRCADSRTPMRRQPTISQVDYGECPMQKEHDILRRRDDFKLRLWFLRIILPTIL